LLFIYWSFQTGAQRNETSRNRSFLRRIGDSLYDFFVNDNYEDYDADDDDADDSDGFLDHRPDTGAAGDGPRFYSYKNGYCDRTGRFYKYDNNDR
jgi:hypothetical protein